MKAKKPRPSRLTFWVPLLAGALLVVYVAAAIVSTARKSPTSDELPHIAAGLSYFVTHQVARANPEHPPLMKELSALSMMAAGIRWPRTPEANELAYGPLGEKQSGLQWIVGRDLIWKAGPDRVLFWGRLPMILTGALLGAAVFFWTRQMFGARAALGALFVFTMDPIVFGHTQLVTTDVGVAAFTVLTLWLLWTWLRTPSWPRLTATGLALGAALAAKFSGVLMLPIVGALLVVEALTRRETPLEKPKAGKASPERSTLWTRVRPVAIALAALYGIAWTVVEATYFFPKNPLLYFDFARLVNANHSPYYQKYLAGELGYHFTSYFPAAYLQKEPIAGLLLAVFGLILLLDRKSVPLLTKLFLLLPPVVYFGVIAAAADEYGVRYLMPVLPFAHIWSGIAIAWLWERAGRSRIAATTLAAACLWLLVAMAGVYPDHLSYFNEAACFSTPQRIGLDGGSRCGVEWLDDSNVDWGRNLKELKWWLDRHAAGRRPRVALFTMFPPQAYGIDAEMIGLPNLAKPTPGLYAVSGHLVARGPAFGAPYQWLRATPPAAIVGHSMWIYDLR